MRLPSFRWWRRMRALMAAGIGSMLLTGCYDIQEVSDVNVVLAIGVDEAGDHLVNVTAEFVNPASVPSSGGDESSSGGGKQPVIIRQETGTSIEDAIGKLEREVPHSVYLAQNMLVLFGQSYAKHGVERALDYFERNRSFRRNQLFLVTPGLASDVLSASVDPEPLNALGIRDLVEQTSTQLRFVQSEQQQVMKEYLSPSQAPIMALIAMNESQHPVLQGVAVFRAGQLVDTLSIQETQGLAWLLGSTRQVAIRLPCDGGDDDGTGTTIRILGSKTWFDSQPVTGGLRVRLRVDARAEIEQICPHEKLDEKKLKQLDQKASTYIQQSMQLALRKLQQDDVDACQLGTRVFMQNPAYWRRISPMWSTIFAKAQVDCQANVQIARANLSLNSPESTASRSGEIPSEVAP